MVADSRLADEFSKLFQEQLRVFYQQIRKLLPTKSIAIPDPLTREKIVRVMRNLTLTLP